MVNQSSRQRIAGRGPLPQFGRRSVAEARQVEDFTFVEEAFKPRRRRKFVHGLPRDLNNFRLGLYGAVGGRQKKPTVFPGRFSQVRSC